MIEKLRPRDCGVTPPQNARLFPIALLTTTEPVAAMIDAATKAVVGHGIGASRMSIRVPMDVGSRTRSERSISAAATAPRAPKPPSVITLTNGGWGGKGAPCALCGDLRDR